MDYALHRYDPPMTASTLVLWIAPLLLVLLGVVFLLRRKPKAQSAVKSQDVLTDEDNTRLAELLNKDK